MNLVAEKSSSVRNDNRVPPGDEGRKRGPRFRYGIGLFVAICIHAGILFGWHKARLFQQVEFGMEASDSSVEVSLVAAPPADEKVEQPEEKVPDAQEMATPPPVEEHPEPTPEPVPEQPPEMTVPEPPPRPVEPLKPKPAKAVPKPKPVPKTAHAAGDGSSAKPGNDATTLVSKSGALSAQAGYLHNPEPAYPEQARVAGFQGVVRLLVKINSQGGVISVQVVRSSGHAILDERARSTVAERWVFKPALSNGMPVPSEVTIPIRFTLNESN